MLKINEKIKTCRKSIQDYRVKRLKTQSLDLKGVHLFTVLLFRQRIFFKLLMRNLAEAKPTK